MQQATLSGESRADDNCASIGTVIVITISHWNWMMHWYVSIPYWYDLLTNWQYYCHSKSTWWHYLDCGGGERVCNG